jgi:hypothetical protein
MISIKPIQFRRFKKWLKQKLIARFTHYQIITIENNYIVIGTCTWKCFTTEIHTFASSNCIKVNMFHSVQPMILIDIWLKSINDSHWYLTLKSTNDSHGYLTLKSKYVAYESTKCMITMNAIWRFNECNEGTWSWDQTVPYIMDTNSKRSIIASFTIRLFKSSGIDRDLFPPHFNYIGWKLVPPV